MHYRQITSPERYLISTLRQWGFTPSQTATVLGRHRSSITREIQRNATRADGCYRPFTASERARGRRSRSRRTTHFTPPQWCYVHRQLRKQWSPEQIAGRLRRAAGRSSAICAARRNSAASATAPTIAAAAWPASG